MTMVSGTPLSNDVNCWNATEYQSSCKVSPSLLASVAFDVLRRQPREFGACVGWCQSALWLDICASSNSAT